MFKAQKKYLILLAFMIPFGSFAQSTGNDEIDIIDLELESSTPKAPEVVTPEPAAIEEPPSEVTDSQSSRSYLRTDEEKTKNNQLNKFSGLGELAPFSEVSIIQKRFLPKTGRFQLFGGATMVTNNPFFLTFGGVAKASYFLTEQWGVELNYFGLTTSTRELTEDLKQEHNVSTESLVYSKSYMGIDVMFIPIYGKMTWFNEKIVPFDLYFSGGYGITGTQGGDNAGTVHLAVGQIFALSKAYAVRWDFSWNFFNAKSYDPVLNTYSSGSFNNLFLTVGMSWFFPEAGYR